MLTLNLYFSAKLKKGFDIFMKIVKKAHFIMMYIKIKKN